MHLRPLAQRPGGRSFRSSHGPRRLALLGARSYVAKANMKRGRQFTVQKLREHFPDSYAPFEIDQVIGRFPTIFRLPLRSTRTDLGLRMDQDMVRKELRGASEIADKLLLFSRNLRRLEFHDGAMLNVIHEATVAEPDKYHGFFSGPPARHIEGARECGRATGRCFALHFEGLARSAQPLWSIGMPPGFRASRLSKRSTS